MIFEGKMLVKIQIDRWMKIKTCQDGKFETVFADIMGGAEEDVWHRVMLGAAVGGRSDPAAFLLSET